MSCRVTYLEHSGFAVRTERRQLLFDYIGGDFVRDPAVPTIALASHAHADHYAPGIQALSDVCVLGEGIEPLAGAFTMRPGDALDAGGAKIRAFGSTDCGVSFLVSCDGLNIFHAGDLNFWHWRAESTDAEVREALSAFNAILDDLSSLPVDLAFFPVDDRMGAGHDEGADMYIERIHPRVLIPMHWWGRKAVAEAFARKHRQDSVRVVALTEPGQAIDLF